MWIVHVLNKMKNQEICLRCEYVVQSKILQATFFYIKRWGLNDQAKTETNPQTNT